MKAVLTMLACGLAFALLMWACPGPEETEDAMVVVETVASVEHEPVAEYDDLHGYEVPTTARPSKQRASRAAASPRSSRRPGTAVAVSGDRLDQIAWCESRLNPTATSSSGKYKGAFQFDDATWRSNGGVGDPRDATYEEQKAVAARLYERRGASPWPTCGR